MIKLRSLIKKLTPGVSFLCLLVLGCAKIEKEPIPRSEAQEKFIKLCKDEFQLAVVTQSVGKTLWIYLPIKENLVEVKASQDGPKDSNQPSEKQSIRFLDSRSVKNNLLVEYDISPNKTYAKDPGYTSGYSDLFQKKQNQIISALQSTFFDAQDPPLFVVFTAADIVRGVEVESILYLEDLKRAMSFPPSITMEEYYKRYISELRGDPKIKDDEKGKHLTPRDITMEEFLSKQVATRVSFKYQRSSFPPSDDPAKEIQNIVNETLEAYSFKGFNDVILRDLQKN